LLRFVVPGVELGGVVRLVDELLCLHSVRNVDFGLAVPWSRSKRRLGVRCTLRQRWARCTFVSFETEMSGSLYTLFVYYHNRGR
jgi:hypothetical protein